MARVTMSFTSACQARSWNVRRMALGVSFSLEISHFSRNAAATSRKGCSKRSHQGYRLNGRTPAQELIDPLGQKQLPPMIPADVLKEKGAAR